MKRRPLHILATLMGVFMLGTMLLLTGCDSDSSPPPPEEEPGAQVNVAENDSLGTYLTDEDGFSLYLFTDGEGNPVPCTSDDCVAAWPIFTTEGDPVAGEGVDASLLGTTNRSDGTTQVVYNGWPLYYFVNDNNPGDVNGQGIESFGGIWYLVTPAGERAQVEDGSSDSDPDGDPGPGDPNY